MAATTDARGDFHFLNLSPGAYSVTLEHDGLCDGAPRRRRLSRQERGPLARMPVAGASEAVTVGAQAPLLDSRKTETGATYDHQELQSIPTTRDVWAILRQTPGGSARQRERRGEDSGSQSAFVGKGSHSDQNTYNLDGVGITAGQRPDAGLFQFRLARQHRGRDRWLRPVDADSRRDSQSRHQARHEPDPGLGARALRRRRGVGLRRRSRRPALERPPLALGRLRASRLRAPGGLYPDGRPGPLSADDHDGECEAERPARPRQLVHIRLHQFRQGRIRASSPAWTAPNPLPSTTCSRTSAYRLEDSEVWSANLFSSLELSYVLTRISQPALGGFEPQAILDQYGVWRNSYQFHHARQPQYQAGLTTSGFLRHRRPPARAQVRLRLQEALQRFRVILARGGNRRLRITGRLSPRSLGLES